MSAGKRGGLMIGVFIFFLGLGFGFALFQNFTAPREPASVQPPVGATPEAPASVAGAQLAAGERVEVLCKLARIVNDYSLELEIRSNSAKPGLRAFMSEGDVEGKTKSARPVAVTQEALAGSTSATVFKGRDFNLSIKPVVGAPREMFRPATLKAEIQKKRVNEELMCKTF